MKLVKSGLVDHDLLVLIINNYSSSHICEVHFEYFCAKEKLGYISINNKMKMTFSWTNKNITFKQLEVSNY